VRCSAVRLTKLGVGICELTTQGPQHTIHTMAALSATFAATAVGAAPKGKAPRSGFRAAMAPKAVAPKCRAAAPAARRAHLQVSALVNGRYEWDQVTHIFQWDGTLHMQAGSWSFHTRPGTDKRGMKSNAVHEKRPPRFVTAVVTSLLWGKWFIVLCMVCYVLCDDGTTSTDAFVMCTDEFTSRNTTSQDVGH
jgi:hypothetical protein